MIHLLDMRCGTLGKGFGLCGWMCGLWQVCCLGRPHCRVRND